MEYDAVLVLGRGIYKDRLIPDSAKSTVEKAIELYWAGQAKRIIFSGKWSYKLDYVPPTTEANAMAEYALTLRLPEEAIILEENSYTTVTNAYFIKKNILIPNNWKTVILVSVHPMDKRAHMVLETVFGPEYVCDVVACNFSFPPDVLKDKEAKEKEKIEYTKWLYDSNGFQPGDHETIFQVTEEDLNKNWRNQNGIPPHRFAR